MSKHEHEVDKRWRVEIALSKDGDETVATAELFLGNEIYEAHGHATREPFSPTVAEELALARALSGLAHQLVDDASREVVHVSRALSRQAQDAEKAYVEISI